jgi:hypothetical protein
MSEVWEFYEAPIEKIEVQENYEGEVFNLQTGTEEYIVNEVVVHNCPHIWRVRPSRVPAGECADLWMGE